MKAFFDTNILIYAQENSPKGNRARELLESGGVLSVQVLNEFASVSARKQGRSWADIDGAISDILDVITAPLTVTLAVHNAARGLAAGKGFSFYDALIVAAALEAGCDTLYTEDMQHDRTVNGLAIVNPFLDIAR